MGDDLTLQLEPRSLTGKKVKTLRRVGMLPANVYGRGLESVAVQAPLREFQRVFRAVHRNAVVQAQIAGEKETRPVVLRTVQRNPASREIQHVDLFQIDLDRPIQAAAAIVLVGDSEAIGKGGVLVQSLSSIMLEALPMQVLAEIEVDISGIDDFGHSVHVGDLSFPEGVRALTDEHAQIVSVMAPRLSAADEEEEAALLAAAAAAAAEAEEGEGVPEGEAAEAGAEGRAADQEDAASR